MPTQNREQVGWIDCPMCNTPGTVHECARGKARKHTLYWRCKCGAIQPWTQTGQAYIAANMTAMDATPRPEPTPESPPESEPVTAGDEEYTPGEPSPESPRKGWLSALMDDEGEG